MCDTLMISLCMMSQQTDATTEQESQESHQHTLDFTYKLK